MLHWRRAKLSRKYPQIELLITHIEVCAVPSYEAHYLFSISLANALAETGVRCTIRASLGIKKGHRSCTPYWTAACGEDLPVEARLFKDRWLFLVEKGL